MVAAAVAVGKRDKPTYRRGTSTLTGGRGAGRGGGRYGTPEASTYRMGRLEADNVLPTPLFAPS